MNIMKYLYESTIGKERKKAQFKHKNKIL